jgi:hypothetical protein
MCGCATPESRIREKPDVFARLTPDQQALVKAGKVEVGFDMDTVRLALGDPDRVVMDTNASGRHEVWRYVTYGEDRAAVYIDGSSSPYNPGGGPYSMSVSGFGSPYSANQGKQWGDLYVRPHSAVYTYGPSPETAYEMIRVVFDTNGRVAQVRERNP